MDFVDATKAFWLNGFKFDGRAPRSEFWSGYLPILAVMIILGMEHNQATSDLVRAIQNGYPTGIKTSVTYMENLSYFAIGVFLIVIVPMVSGMVRRLHDRGVAGGWAVVGIIPFIGAIWALIVLTGEGTKGPNRFGSDPLHKPIPDLNPDDQGSYQLIPPAAKKPRPKTATDTSKPKSALSEPQSTPAKPDVMRANFNDLIDEDALYEQAFNEMEGGKRVVAAWSRAFAEAAGDEQKAKALYIQSRVVALKQELLDQFEADRLEAERAAKEEADRKAREEEERKVREHAEHLAKKDAERKAKQEAAAKELEKERLIQAAKDAAIEEERKAKEEAERLAKEEAERLAKEEAERLAKEEAERLAKEEAERLAKEEAERLAREEAGAKKAKLIQAGYKPAEAARLTDVDASEPIKRKANLILAGYEKRLENEEREWLENREKYQILLIESGMSGYDAMGKTAKFLDSEARAKTLRLVEDLEKAKVEADRKALEDAQRLAKEEAERLAGEEAERLAKEEADWLTREHAGWHETNEKYRDLLLESGMNAFDARMKTLPFVSVREREETLLLIKGIKQAKAIKEREQAFLKGIDDKEA